MLGKSTLRQQLHKARPKLKSVSPLGYWTVMVMALFNLVFGASLFLLLDTGRVSAPLIIVNDFLTYKFWGVLFIAIGLMKMFALLTNRWELARTSLIVGVAIKAAWSIALIIRVLTSPGTFFVTILWLTVASLQMGAYIWFLPHGFVGNGKKD